MAEVSTNPNETERVVEQIRKCSVSRTSRRSNNEDQRMWYERGTDNGPRATVNKLKSHLDRVASYLYAPDSVRFGMHLPPSVRLPWLDAAELARDELRERWRDSGADLVAALMLEWSLVYGSTVGKLESDPGTGFRLGYIQPFDFGVSREDVPQLDEQDLMCHWYTLSLAQIERWLYDDPRSDKLMDLARQHTSMTPPGVPRSGLVMSSITGIWPNSSVEGGFPGDPDVISDVIAPAVDEPCVTFVDCWERRLFRRRYPFGKKPEVFEDWLVSTVIADANVLFVQRRNPSLPWTRTAHNETLQAEHPFAMMVPRPMPDFAFGRSELGEMRKLQQWTEGLFVSMNDNVKRQLDPSKFFSGVPDWEEANRAMSTEGGGYGSADPGAKMEVLKAQIGQEAFEFLNRLNGAFAEISGVPESLSEPGSMPGGVRSTGQFSQVASIGAGRIRRMALVVEDCIGQIATKGFKMLQRHETAPYTLRDGKTFLLSQLPAGITIRVNAHSAAPIFAEQTTNKALLLQKMGALGPEDAVELIDPPNRDELKQKARVIAENKSQFAQKKLEIEEEKATKGRAPARK